MRKSTLLLSSSILMIALTGCASKTRQIYTGQTQLMPSITAFLTDRERGDLVKLAALKKGWRCQKISNEKSKCDLKQRNHYASIEVIHNKRNYTINYIDSLNLKHNKDQIHSQYNKWIKALEVSIFQTMLKSD